MKSSMATSAMWIRLPIAATGASALWSRVAEPAGGRADEGGTGHVRPVDLKKVDHRVDRHHSLFLGELERYSTVLGLAVLGVVRCDRIALPEAFGIEPALVHPSLDQFGDNSLGAGHRQGHVALLVAVAVRERLNVDHRFRTKREIA